MVATKAAEAVYSRSGELMVFTSFAVEARSHPTGVKELFQSAAERN
jgi:hypothetical protein